MLIIPLAIRSNLPLFAVSRLRLVADVVLIAIRSKSAENTVIVCLSVCLSVGFCELLDESIMRGCQTAAAAANVPAFGVTVRITKVKVKVPLAVNGSIP